MLAPVPVAPVNETDMVLLPDGLKALKRVAKEVGLDLKGAYLNLDGGFDSAHNRKMIFNAGMIPNIKENPRNELVASFPECKRCAPSPWCRTRMGDDYGTVRKMRGTLWQRVRRNAHDHCLVCSCALAVYWLSIHAFPPHISRG